MSYDKEYKEKVAQTLKQIDQLYDSMYQLVALWAVSANIDRDKRFWFNQYLDYSNRVDQLIQYTSKLVDKTIRGTINDVWKLSQTKNNVLQNKYHTEPIQTQPLETQAATNLETFLNRKVGGLNLSQRVWKYNPSVKAQMQAAIDIAIKEGKSAQYLAKQLKVFLNEPDKLFRKVRDEYGNLKWSKKAMMYNPGQGVYKSAYQNSLRLARNEINTAYREADYQRWQKMDFITGYRIQNSTRISTVCPICKQFDGVVFPKSFKFTGFHVQCLCVAIPVTIDEMPVVTMPTEFLDYVERSKGKINPNNAPNWYKDNREVLAQSLQGDYINKTKDQANKFHQTSKKIAMRSGVRVSKVNVKTDSSIIDKAMRDYNGNILQVKDIIRNTFLTSNDQDKLIQDISSTFEVVRIKKQLANNDPLGYSGTIINVKLDDNIFAEMQINSAALLYGKDLGSKTILGNETFEAIRKLSGLEPGLGHKYYEEWRILDQNIPDQLKHMQRLEEASKKYYSILRNLKKL